MRPHAPALAVLALALTGCGSSNHADTHFESTADLVETVTGAGMDCTAFDPKNADETNEALEQHDWVFEPCDSGTAMLFTSDAKRDDIREKNLDEGQAWLQGGNWAVMGDQFLVEEVHQSMGGDITTA